MVPVVGLSALRYLSEVPAINLATGGGDRLPPVPENLFFKLSGKQVEPSVQLGIQAIHPTGNRPMAYSDFNDDTIEFCGQCIQDAFKAIDDAKRLYNLAVNDNAFYSTQVAKARIDFDRAVTDYQEMIARFEGDGMIPRAETKDQMVGRVIMARAKNRAE